MIQYQTNMVLLRIIQFDLYIPIFEVDTAMKELEEGSLAIESEMRGLARSGAFDLALFSTCFLSPSFRFL